MAYYLQFDGVDDCVHVPSGVRLTNAVFTIAFKVAFKDGKVSAAIFSDIGSYNVGNNLYLWGLSTSPVFQLRSSGTSTNLYCSYAFALDGSETYDCRIESDGTTYSLYVNDVLEDSALKAAPLSGSYATFIGVNPSGVYSSIDLYYLEITNNGVLTNNYQPSEESKLSNTLIDTVSGNHGTPVNFTDFDASLIYYYDWLNESADDVLYDNALDFGTTKQYADLTGTMEKLKTFELETLIYPDAQTPYGRLLNIFDVSIRMNEGAALGVAVSAKRSTYASTAWVIADPTTYNYAYDGSPLLVKVAVNDNPTSGFMQVELWINDQYVGFSEGDDISADSWTASYIPSQWAVGAYYAETRYNFDYRGKMAWLKIKGIDLNNINQNYFFDFNQSPEINYVPELITGVQAPLVNFPAPSGYVRDENGVIEGYALNDVSQSISYPLVGAWSGVITYVDGSTANVSGTDTYVINGSTPVQIKYFDTTTNYFDHTTGDADQIIDTVGGNHATIVNAPTSGYLPVVERQVFDANDYANLAGLATAETASSYQSEYRGATSAGATINGFSDGLRIIDSTITSAITSTISGQLYVDNSTLDDIDVSGATGDTFIINSGVNDVTG